MSKYRVYELVKELQADTKVVLNILEKNGHKVGNLSVVGDDVKELLAKELKKQRQPQSVQQPKTAPTMKKAEQKPASKDLQQKPVQQAKPAVQVKTVAQAKTMVQQPQQRQAQQPLHSQQARQQQQRPQQGQRPPQRFNQQSENRSGHQDNRQGGFNNNNRDRFNNNRNGQGINNGQHNGNGQMNHGFQQNRNQRPQGNNGQRNGGQNGSYNRGGQQNGGNRPNRLQHTVAQPMPETTNRRANDQQRRNRDNNNQYGKENRGGRGNSRFDGHNMQNGNYNNFGAKGNKNKKNKNKQQQQAPKVEIARPKHIKLPEQIAVKDLASKMSLPATDIIKKLMLMGVMATINQEIDYETAALVAEEFGVTSEELPPETDPTEIPEIEDSEKSLVLRPPVVTVMGHVDHGKTSLLDVIRKTSVTSTEAGGITQHIGAYQVMCSGKKIVFLDTPGHEAFTAMRARGAQVTDIAVLVVAADDGVMPQTIEAINHAKAAKVPIIVAINKIDKPGANPEHVKQQLAEHELVPEDWGGETIMVPVSAKKKIGINDLLEMILLVAEVQELKANPNRDARGIIIEAQLDKGRGPVATVLVQKGTLRIGDSVVAGTTYGKVRAMINDRGENVKKAGPSMPVEVLGLSDVPGAGDEMAALEEKLARSIAEKRIEKQRNELIRTKKVSLDDLFQQIQDGNIKDLNILIKADVQGSVEALTGSLLALNKNNEVRVSIVHSGVGAVNESDVMLASAANALIIAFNVRPDNNARKVADAENIDIRTYRVIYDALNDVKDAMSGMLAPKFKEVIQGKVEIRQVMKFNKLLIAGSYVQEGKICNNSKIRLLRDNIEIFDGEIDSLRRFKDDVKEVAAGYECGLTLKDYRDFREGDILEVYKMEEIATSIAEANAKADS